MSSISSLSNNYLQSILSTALQGTGLTNKTAGSSPSGIAVPADTGQLSPFAQLLSTCLLYTSPSPRDS